MSQSPRIHLTSEITRPLKSFRPGDGSVKRGSGLTSFSAVLAVLGLIAGPALAIAFSAAPASAQEPAATKKADDLPKSAPVDSVAEEKPKTEARPWNQWRGPLRSTEFVGPKWPEKIAADSLKAVWSRKLGPSYSGPISDGTRIFTTETADKKTEVVRAYDLKSGEPLWQASWPGAMSVPFFAAKNGSWIRSTPACDQERVFVLGMLDVLVCLDSASGKENWKIDFAERFGSGVPSFGAVCSPLLDEKHVYLQAANRFFKIEKKTGEIVWQSMEEDGGMMSGGSFSSPAFAKIADQELILVQSRTTLAGVKPDSGQVLWKTEVPNFRGMNILTPIPFQDDVFTSSYNNQSYLYDVPSGEPDASANVAPIWTSSAKGYMSTPAVVDGFAYLLLQNGRMGCLELKTGERKWTSSEKFGDYCSFVMQGDRLLCLTDDGRLRLLKASTEDCEVISEYQLPETNNSWAHIGMGVNPAGQIQVYVRGLESLTVYNWAP